MAEEIEQYEFEIAGIDTFGNRTVPSEAIIELLGVTEGVRFGWNMPNVRKMRENIQEYGFFSHVHIAFVLYPNGNAYITVDVIEKTGDGQFTLRPPPIGSSSLPSGTLEGYDEYMALWGQMIRCRRATTLSSEESPFGHRFSADTQLRELEEGFIDRTKAHLQSLIDALENDQENKHRIVSAFMLGWAPDPAPTVAPLLAALSDSHAIVRNNAALSLKHASHIAIRTNDFTVSLPPVLELLHFPSATDRQKAALVLVELAKSEPLRATILKEAGDQIMHMLALKQPSNRKAACELLRQLSGLEYTVEQYSEWNGWYQQAIRGAAAPLPERLN